MCCYW